jgi:hypothetical protein
MRRRLYLPAVFVFCLALPGCDSDPLQKVQVRGTVTFDGGQCPGDGRVTFSPTAVAEGLPIRPATGSFSTDGVYEAMSFRPGDGLVPGKYLVGVACFDPSKLSGAPSDAEYHNASYVSEDFRPLELVVEAGSGAMEFNLDVPKR